MIYNNADTLLEAGAAMAAAEKAPTSLAYVLVPEGYNIESLEPYLPAPARKSGSRSFNDAASFIGYVLDQAGPGPGSTPVPAATPDAGPNATAEPPVAPVAAATTSTKLYGGVNPPHFTAVFNDHGDHASAPGWRDHTASYACPLSVEWKTWTGKNKQQMTQETFAQFIEDNAPDCVTPDSATMIEIARTLEAKKKVNFASGIRLSNGENELTYEETIEGTAGKGKFKIPETFALAIPVLEGAERWRVDARLRYRIDGQGKLSIWYDLERPHKVLENAVREVWQAISHATGRPIYNGG
jgi:uncharacterized protein YfdQ (DUF2303 family)